MRNALLITLSLIFTFVLIGVIYNLMAPYLVKLGLIEHAALTKAKRDGGVFRSVDFARSWEHVINIENNGDLSKTDVLDVRFDVDDYNSLFIATSKGLYKSQDLGEGWSRIQSGALAGEVAVQSFLQDLTNVKRKYVAVYSGERGYILKSRGDKFYEVYSTNNKNDKVLGIWLDHRDSATIYAGTQEGLLLESKDFGESWRIKWEFGDSLRDLKILRNDPGTMYVIIGGGDIFRSGNNGGSWQNISGSFAKFGPDFFINKFIVDPHNESRLYLASNMGLAKSEDGGATFNRVGILAEAGSEVSTVVVDSQRSNIIYIGSGNQIHKSDDGGMNWQIKTLDTSRKINVISTKPDDSSVIFIGVRQ